MYCSRLFVPLASPKVLSFGKTNKKLFLFGFSLTYSYFCTKFERITKKLGKKNEKRFLDSRHFMRLHDAMDNGLHRQKACVHG